MCCERFDISPLLINVRRDLGGWPTEITRNAGMRLRLSETAIITLRERRRKLFMAHIDGCEFSLSGCDLLNVSGRIHARQKGWFRRKPVIFCARDAGLSALAGHLNGSASLRQTLSELDYSRFQLTFNEGTWHCTLQPWGASQVVCRLPPLQRYVSLVPRQRMLLLSVLSMINEAIGIYQNVGHSASTGSR